MKNIAKRMCSATKCAWKANKMAKQEKSNTSHVIHVVKIKQRGEIAKKNSILFDFMYYNT